MKDGSGKGGRMLTGSGWYLPLFLSSGADKQGVINDLLLNFFFIKKIAVWRRLILYMNNEVSEVTRTG